ncbi:predicted protein [Postia placenta Mad-698-R]|nr:predicted protein [Postia placenta Mad-698-R]
MTRAPRSGTAARKTESSRLEGSVLDAQVRMVSAFGRNAAKYMTCSTTEPGCGVRILWHDNGVPAEHSATRLLDAAEPVPAPPRRTQRLQQVNANRPRERVIPDIIHIQPEEPVETVNAAGRVLTKDELEDDRVFRKYWIQAQRQKLHVNAEWRRVFKYNYRHRPLTPLFVGPEFYDPPRPAVRRPLGDLPVCPPGEVFTELSNDRES